MFIHRKVYLALKAHLDKPEMSLILGPRQAGKTTLMRHLSDELDTEPRKHAYFNLDVIEDRQYFTTQHSLLAKIKSIVGETKAVICIDEIQRLENAGLFLKGLYDLGTPYKFVISGSGSLELKAHIIEPMTGRKQVFSCLPLSFTEFGAYRLGVDFGGLEKALESNPYERERLIDEYLTFGGYPRVVIAPTTDEKIAILSEIYRSYLEKDIQIILGVEKEEAFGMLVKLLALQTGNIINRAELSATLGIAEKTVEKYLGLLEKTFVLSLVRPYFHNARKELVKSPKVYFFDMGFLNFARGATSGGVTPGGVFENACYLRLLELETHEPVRYWRSTAGAEVDFVLVKNGKPYPIEVKMQMKGESLGKSLAGFLSQYKAEKVVVYTKNDISKFEKFGAAITVLPYHHLPTVD